jgi:hypothetical protein
MIWELWLQTLIKHITVEANDRTVPAHLQKQKLDSTGAIKDLVGPQPAIARILAVAINNSGHKAPEDKDFQILVDQVFRVVTEYFTEMTLEDVADALFKGSIGRFGTYFGINLRTIYSWLSEKRTEINCKSIEESTYMESQNQARWREINSAHRKIKEVAIREKEELGITDYPYLLAVTLPKLYNRLHDMNPSLVELVFMTSRYAAQKAAEPEPRTFLAEIREQGLLTEETTSEIHQYIESITNN